MANLKNITELPVVESADGLNLIVNDNGAAKQISANKVGKVKTVNGIEPDGNGNINIEIPEGFSGSWNDLKDKPVKLSEFENDLFYSKRESFLKLTPASFTRREEMFVYDSGQPALDWLTSKDKLGYCIVGNKNGEAIVATEKESPVMDGYDMGLPDEVASTAFACSEVVMIGNGILELGPNFMVAVPAEVMEVLESIELFRIEVKKLPDEVQTNSDWNENDPTKAGYIKNRPFYEETDEVEIVPLTVLNFNLDYAPNIEVFSYEMGQAVIVEFDGKKYETTIGEGFFMGDAAHVASITTDDNVEIDVVLDSWCVRPTPPLSGEHIICMYYQDTKVKQIDAKYLPDVGSKSYYLSEFTTSYNVNEEVYNALLAFYNDPTIGFPNITIKDASGRLCKAISIRHVPDEDGYANSKGFRIGYCYFYGDLKSQQIVIAPTQNDANDIENKDMA